MTTKRWVNTHELNNGDMISCHGATLRLSNRKDHGLHPYSDHTAEKHGSIITFDVERVGEEYGSFPKHWLDSTDPQERYHVQGNRLASWSKIID